jgi:uncharacterized protein YcbK (DUF882 family)
VIRVLPLVLLLLSSTAWARGAPQKSPSLLSPKQKALYDRQLRARIGKAPAKLINVWYSRTQEWMVLDARKGATIDQKTANSFFRCHFTNQPPPAFDLRLIGVLIDAALHFKVDHIDIVSGYRAPKYNLQLRKKGHEVARDSQHTYGHAVDFRLPGIPTTTLRDWTRRLHLGGVGFYPESAFVHADVGPVRYWIGR